MLGEICGWPIARFDAAELKGGGYIRELYRRAWRGFRKLSETRQRLILL